jgi:hypothetical protein
MEVVEGEQLVEQIARRHLGGSDVGLDRAKRLGRNLVLHAFDAREEQAVAKFHYRHVLAPWVISGSGLRRPPGSTGATQASCETGRGGMAGKLRQDKIAGFPHQDSSIGLAYRTGLCNLKRKPVPCRQEETAAAVRNSLRGD